MAGKPALKIFSRKAQIESGDLFISATIFIILISGVLLAFNHYTERFESQQEFRGIQSSALQITGLMVKSEGVPAGWHLNPNSTRTIGLAYSRHEPRNISPAKLETFTNMSYDDIRDIAGVPHEFYFRLTDLKGGLISEKGDNSTGDKAVSIQRKVLYKGREAIVSFRLWR